MKWKITEVLIQLMTDFQSSESTFMTRDDQQDRNNRILIAIETLGPLPAQAQ